MQKMNICIYSLDLFGDILGTITPKKINKKTTKQNKRVEEVGFFSFWASLYRGQRGRFGDLVLPQFTAASVALKLQIVWGDDAIWRTHEHVLDFWQNPKTHGEFSLNFHGQNPAPKELVDAIVLHWETQPCPTMTWKCELRYFDLEWGL